METINIPIIINGEVFYPSEDRDNYILEYETGNTVIIPKPTADDIKKLKEADKFILHNIHYQDIINILVRVGEFWNPRNINHPLYQKAMKYLSAVNGYDLKMAQRELNLINSTCAFGDVLHDMLDAELGNKFYLEEWVPLQDALVHAQPQGNVLNIMVGNVPISSIMCLVRGLITKNRTISKLPSRDPITSLFFALSFLEVAKDDPVTKSLSVLYWPHGDCVENELMDISDIVCVWGGGNAIEATKKKASSAKEILEFGPKVSFSLVGKESCDSEKVAIDLAHDISIYNQEACFSPQMAFVEGDVDIFITNLKKGLELYERLLPKGVSSIDVHAHIQRARIEAQYMEHEVLSPKNTSWTIIKCNTPKDISEHPLGRTIYIIPVKNINECLSYVNEKTQTITISPWVRNVEIRDEATLKGASKITEIGLAEWQRVGVPHDNIFPLHKMVRWVGVERGLNYLGKHIVYGPLDTTLWLMMDENKLEEY